jgi:integrase
MRTVGRFQGVPQGTRVVGVHSGRSLRSGNPANAVRSPAPAFRTREEAEAARTKELAALSAGTWSDDQGVTVGVWLDQWLDELAVRGRSPKTLSNYRGHVRDVWRPRLGQVRLRELRRGHIERIIADLAAPKEGERPAGNVGRRVQQRTAGTIAGYHRTIRAALAVAVRRELIPFNPAAGRMDALPAAAEEEEPTVWQPEETARFLEHVKADRLSAMYELAAYAGLRRAELCGLRWADLDPDGGGLTVRLTGIEVSRSEVPTGGLLREVCGGEHVGRCFKRPKSRAGATVGSARRTGSSGARSTSCRPAGGT